jgi:hypothetical protein
MVRTTRKQREALFRVFRRDFPSWVSPGKREALTGNVIAVPTIQWRRFRKEVKPCFGDVCVMIYWQGMWLGIEPDGHTHS